MVDGLDRWRQMLNMPTVTNLPGGINWGTQQYQTPGYGTQQGQFTQQQGPSLWQDAPIAGAGKAGTNYAIGGQWGTYIANPKPLEYMPADRAPQVGTNHITGPLTPPQTGQNFVTLPEQGTGGAGGGQSYRWSQGEDGVGHTIVTKPDGTTAEYHIGWGANGGLPQFLEALGLGEYARGFSYGSMTAPTEKFSGHDGYAKRGADGFAYKLREFLAAGQDPQTAAQNALAQVRAWNGGTLAGTGFDALESTGTDRTQVDIGNGNAGNGAGNGAQNGSTDVSVPGMGAGAAAGAAAAGAAGQTGQGNPQYDTYLAESKAGRLAALMQRLGLADPMRQRSVYGSAVGGRLSQVLDPWMQTQGLGGGDVSGVSGMIDKFVGNFRNGGGGMGAIAGDARTGLQTVMSDPRYAALEDPEVIALIQGISQLANINQNEWLQRAYGNIQDDSVGGFYGAINQAARNGGDPASIRYLPHIKNNPLYNFMTGR